VGGNVRKNDMNEKDSESGWSWRCLDCAVWAHTAGKAPDGQRGSRKTYIAISRRGR